MAKKKSAVAIIPKLEAAPMPRSEVPETFIVFPKKSRCPKCSTLATRATSTVRETGVQYRRCLRPSCRETYKELGVLMRKAAPAL